MVWVAISRMLCCGWLLADVDYLQDVVLWRIGYPGVPGGAGGAGGAGVPGGAGQCSWFTWSVFMVHMVSVHIHHGSVHYNMI